MRDIAEMKRIDDEMRVHDASIHVLRSGGREFSGYSLRGKMLPHQVVRDMVNDGWLIELAGGIIRRPPLVDKDWRTPAALAVIAPTEPNIVRMLDCSTAHLTEPERAALVCGDVPGQISMTEYGGVINTASWDLSGEPPPNASEAFNAVIRHALARKCQYVLFDRDAPELPGFPTFED